MRHARHCYYRRRAPLRRIASIGCAISVLSPAHLLAQDNADQDVSPNLSVSERFAQNFVVDGVRSGSFVLFPTVSYVQTYDDNIFSAPTNRTDDFIGDINATLSVQSDWDAHGLNISGSVRRLQYFDNDSESTTDYGVLAQGVIDLARRSTATLSAGYARSTEARRSLQTAFGDSPVRFSTSRAGIDFDLTQNRFREQFGVAYRHDNFDDVLAPGTGLPIDQDFRDRDSIDAYYRQSFRIRPTIALFAEGRFNTQQFDANQLGVGANQDSQTFGGLGGIALDINKVARGEVAVGYQSRNYDSNLFEDISGLNVDASLEYFLSDLTTITISADRSIQNTAVIGVAGYQSTGADITVEHELLRPLMIVARADYRNDDFRGVDRTDELFRVSVGADYAFRRNLVFTIRYIHLDVSSDGLAARPGFDENIVQFGLEFRR